MNTREPWNLKKTYLYLSSQFFSIFGSSVVDYVLIWYITLKSGSSLILSSSLVLTYLPKIFGAYLVEKKLQIHRVKLVLMMSDLLIAVFSTALAALIFVGWDTYGILLSMMALRAVFSGIQNPCEKILLTEITPEASLEKMNGYNAAISSLCSLAAPALGAIIIVRFSMPIALMFDLATALCAIILLLFLKVSLVRTDCSEKCPDDGIHDEIKKVFCWHAGVTFLIVPIAFLTPLLITTAYHDDVMKLACNEIAYSLGAILCGLCAGTILVRLKGTLGFPSTVFAVSVFTVALAYCVKWFPVYCLFMLLASFFINIFQIQVITALQKKSSLENRTLVFSKLEIITNLALPAGMLLWGSISDIITIEYSLVYSGLALCLFGFVGKVFFREGACRR